MTHLLDAEGWEDTNRPQQLACFCGVMSDAPNIPDPSDPDFPIREYERARRDAVEYLRLHALSSVAGSTQYRLRADQSGFSNLYLAGDWIRNGFDTPGCIESGDFR